MIYRIGAFVRIICKYLALANNDYLLMDNPLSGNIAVEKDEGRI
jgi:hypothetical protein